MSRQSRDEERSKNAWNERADEGRRGKKKEREREQPLLT